MLQHKTNRQRNDITSVTNVSKCGLQKLWYLFQQDKEVNKSPKNPSILGAQNRHTELW